MGTTGNIFARLGLIRRRERYGLTTKGWAAAIVLVLLVAGCILYNLNSFLAPVERVKADVMVLEGWIPDYAFPQAIREFRTGHYRLIIATGGPILKGSFLSGYGNYARLSAATLIALGVGKDSVVSVPAPFIIKDRTYESAVALREWIDSTGTHINSFNIFTLGAHGRRTHLLFEEAFGEHERIGIISCVDKSFNPRLWWTSSQGVRKVLDETIAYLYARLLFYPATTR